MCGYRQWLISRRNMETERKEEIYDLLLKILETRQDYEKMGEVLKKCNIPRIVSKYNKYAALGPEFNKEEGVYDELISITIKGNTEGFVYYTLDGSVPTRNSMVYESPILSFISTYWSIFIYPNKIFPNDF